MTQLLSDSSAQSGVKVASKTDSWAKSKVRSKAKRKARKRGKSVSASSERLIPLELLEEICEYLADDKAFGTLAAVLQTGSLAYDVAACVLYREVTIDDNFPAFLAGLEHASGTKQQLLRNVRQATVGIVSDNDVLRDCIERKHFAPGMGLDAPLFPYLDSLHISASSFLNMSAGGDHPIRELLRGCRPSHVCVSYPPPRLLMAIASVLVLWELRPDIPQCIMGPLMEVAKRVALSGRSSGLEDVRALGSAESHFELPPGLNREELRMVKELQERRGRRVHVLLSAPRGIDALMKLLRPKNVTLHGFYFYSDDSEAEPNCPLAIDPMAWPSPEGKLRIMATTPADTHGGHMPDKACPVDYTGEPLCTCNGRDIWERLQSSSLGSTGGSTGVARAGSRGWASVASSLPRMPLGVSSRLSMWGIIRASTAAVKERTPQWCGS